MKRPVFPLIAALLFSVLAAPLDQMAFCGFYVAKADASLFNNTSEVILVRDEGRTVVTMKSDFDGDVSEFAMVVPVPVILKEHDIRVVRNDVFQKLNDYSAPRLVEYYDTNPCEPQYLYRWTATDSAMAVPTDLDGDFVESDEELGVTIEAQYLVGEYDILILSANDSKGLKTWLNTRGYRIPKDANEVLDPYIRNQLKFFVVKVNEEAYANLGSKGLSPIQIDYNTDRFMLPIRLGMANSRGTQDMIVYAFSMEGRVECTNYRSVEMPTGNQIPLFVKQDFGDFYTDVFDRQYRQQGRNAVFTEYAWTVTPNWGGMKCDPCVGNPPMPQEFADAGVWWANLPNQPVFFTRMHVRYSRDKFPQDLQFQTTPNKTHYQARYVLTHSAGGDFSCEQGQKYLKSQRKRRQNEVQNLTDLAGWTHHKSGKYIRELDHLMEDTPQDSDGKGEIIPVTELPPPTKGPGAGLIVMISFFALMLTLKLFDRKKPVTA